MINGLIGDFGSGKEFSGRGRLLPSVAAVTLCCVREHRLLPKTR
jgi:hypothetical protein